MNNYELVSLSNTDITEWDFIRLKAELERGLRDYTGIVYTDDSIKDAKKDRSTLNKVKKAIEDARKAYKARCLEPYEAIEPRIKELVEMVETQRGLIDQTVKEYENRQQAEKEQSIREYYDQKAAVLGEFADRLYENLLDKKWLNASTARAKYQEGIAVAVQRAENDLQTIRGWQSPIEDELLNLYAETASLEQAQIKNQEFLTTAERAGLLSAVNDQNMVSADNGAAGAGSTQGAANTNQSSESGENGVLIRVFASQRQLDQICDFMKAIGVNYELL